MRTATVAAAICAVLLLAASQPERVRAAPASPATGQEVKHDKSPPLRSISPTRPQNGHAFPARHRTGFADNAEAPRDAHRQAQAGAAGAIQSGVGWEGISNINGLIPPDTNGDVGPSNYVQWVNASFQIWDKSGNSLYGPAGGNTLWSGFGGVCETTNMGDPIVLYDKLAGRWVFAQFAFNTRGGNPVAPYYECIAVSQTGDPTGSYYRYAFAVNANINSSYFPDYPKLGVGPDGYYMSTNNFNGNTFVGAGAYAFNRTAMLNGQAANFVAFQLGSKYEGILPANFDGTTPPPSGSPAYFGSVDTSDPLLNGTGQTFQLWQLHADFATPANSTFTGPTNVSVSPYTFAFCGHDYGAGCIAQPGTSQTLDPMADRMMNRLDYRNFGDHESLVASHTVNVGSNQAGVRWYEIRSPGSASPQLYQQGTYAPSDGVSRWMGSATMNGSGSLALGYSASSSTTVYPSIRYTGRLPNDPLGTLPQSEQSVVSGGGSQTGYSRWGDYSAISVDPSDDTTFWYTQEYYSATSAAGWQTKVGSFKLGSPPAASTGQPTSVGQSAATLTGSVNPEGLPTTYHFDYGTTASYGSQVPASDQSVGSDSATHSVSANAAGLTPGTTYHFRVVATNSLGTTYGQDQTFATQSSWQQAPQGNWVGVYGHDGYSLLGWNGSSDLTSLPAGVTMGVDQGARYTWASSTTDQRALESPDQSQRVASTLYDANQVRLHLSFANAYSGNLHLYAYDWGSTARRETITVDDGSGPQTTDLSSSFTGGAWVSAPISVAAGGSVTITVTHTAGSNAVLSGVLLGDDPQTALSWQQPPQGNWVGAYGNDGYSLLGWNGSSDLTSLPAGVTMGVDQGTRYRWASSTTAVQALESPDQSQRVASTLYDANQVRLHLSFANAYSGNLHLYAYDWGSTARRETITVNDGSGQQTATLSSSFNGGAWVSAPISVPAGGTVTIAVTHTAGSNAVLSGVLLGDYPQSALTWQQPPQGNWVGTYGSTGYSLLGWNGSSDVTSLPAGTTMGIDQGARYLWASSTTAVQALESADQSQRVASTLYDANQVRLHLSFANAYSGNLHLYAYDWGSTARRETITVNDGSGPQTANLSSSFNGGAWVSAPISVPAGGTVTITVTHTAGTNAVLSGIFLD